jgi:hypothetical protein
MQAFVQEAVAPGSLHTDGLLSYDRLEKYGYRHRITFVKARKESASELLPRVHQVISLLKRWLLGTHQGTVSRAHLDYYLDEFTFRFNRRTARHRGKLFYRLVQQAVAVERRTRRSSSMCDPRGGADAATRYSGHLSQGDTPTFPFQGVSRPATPNGTCLTAALLTVCSKFSGSRVSCARTKKSRASVIA